MAARQERIAVVPAWKSKGWNKSFRWRMTATELKISLTYQVGDVSFHGQMTIKCNSKVFDSQTGEQMHYTHSHRIWEGRREKTRLSTTLFTQALDITVTLCWLMAPRWFGGDFSVQMYKICLIICTLYLLSSMKCLFSAESKRGYFWSVGLWRG